MSRKDKYNSSGCLDMTAYLALRNIEREERVKKHKQINVYRHMNSSEEIGENKCERRCKYEKPNPDPQRFARFSG